jgi:aerobic-type carbon monoxide dehydrogenase small subunit (CoxS/CutS family)
MAPEPAKRILTLDVNGARHEVAAAPQAILLDVLRDELLLTGTKRGCDMGTCGCCTVIIDGEARLSCLTLAAQAAGKAITTIEGVGHEGHLHPVQQCFAEWGGSQCGFCTPGFVMATKALLDHHPQPSEGEVREALSGNLCRCTGYVKIFEAVQAAAAKLREGAPPEPWLPAPKPIDVKHLPKPSTEVRVQRSGEGA